MSIFILQKVLENESKSVIVLVDRKITKIVKNAMSIGSQLVKAYCQTHSSIKCFAPPLMPGTYSMSIRIGSTDSNSLNFNVFKYPVVVSSQLNSFFEGELRTVDFFIKSFDGLVEWHSGEVVMQYKREINLNDYLPSKILTKVSSKHLQTKIGTNL